MSRGWFEPSDLQRDLLRIILLADFPARDAIRAAMEGVLVRPACECGCGSFNFKLAHAVVLPEQEWPVGLSADGIDGGSALVLLFAHQPGIFELEIAPTGDGFGSIIPASIRDYHKIEEGPGFATLVARERTLLEEAEGVGRHDE